MATPPCKQPAAGRAAAHLCMGLFKAGCTYMARIAVPCPLALLFMCAQPCWGLTGADQSRQPHATPCWGLQCLLLFLGPHRNMSPAWSNLH